MIDCFYNANKIKFCTITGTGKRNSQNLVAMIATNLISCKQDSVKLLKN